MSRTTHSTDWTTTTADDPEQLERLSELLNRSSRTFALSIPFLPDRLREEITVAYLIFRIADTIEDEVDWPATEKSACLRMFARVLPGLDHASAGELVSLFRSADVAHEGYAALMADAELVLTAYAGLRPGARAAIGGHLVRTADGMADRLEGSAGGVGLDAVRAYCYTVAGIVGEMCTELFIGHDPALGASRDELMRLAPAFGESLQLVNILRDEGDDAEAGRGFIPADVSRASLLGLAREGCEGASAYIRAMEDGGASPGTVAFNAVNLALALDTLDLLERRGPGVKISRDRVAERLEDITARVEQGRRVWPVAASDGHGRAAG